MLDARSPAQSTFTQRDDDAGELERAAIGPYPRRSAGRAFVGVEREGHLVVTRRPSELAAAGPSLRRTPVKRFLNQRRGQREGRGADGRARLTRGWILAVDDVSCRLALFEHGAGHLGPERAGIPADDGPHRDWSRAASQEPAGQGVDPRFARLAESHLAGSSQAIEASALDRQAAVADGHFADEARTRAQSAVEGERAAENASSGALGTMSRGRTSWATKWTCPRRAPRSTCPARATCAARSRPSTSTSSARGGPRSATRSPNRRRRLESHERRFGGRHLGGDSPADAACVDVRGATESRCAAVRFERREVEGKSVQRATSMQPDTAGRRRDEDGQARRAARSIDARAERERAIGGMPVQPEVERVERAGHGGVRVQRTAAGPRTHGCEPRRAHVERVEPGREPPLGPVAAAARRERSAVQLGRDVYARLVELDLRPHAEWLFVEQQIHSAVETMAAPFGAPEIRWPCSPTAGARRDRASGDTINGVHYGSSCRGAERADRQQESLPRAAEVQLRATSQPSSAHHTGCATTSRAGATIAPW